LGVVRHWWLLFAAVPLVSAVDALLGREVRESAADRPFVFDPLHDPTGEQLVTAVHDRRQSRVHLAASPPEPALDRFTMDRG
jgi:hypothetical protein